MPVGSSFVCGKSDEGGKETPSEKKRPLPAAKGPPVHEIP